jgi:ethanolamine permease
LHHCYVMHQLTEVLFYLGIAIVIGGQLFSWNVSLLGGFWEAFLGMILTGLGYLCLVLCLAEMTSALPFSGGSYGFVRVCLGPFFGYLIGCCETMQNIAYVISAVIPFGQMLTMLFKAKSKYEPAYWTFFFLSAVAINVAGGKTFWWFSRIIGIVSLLLVLIYIGTTAQFGDFNTYAEATSTFSAENFIVYLPLASWYYIGVEALPLACVDCEKPEIQIPRGMTLCILTLIGTAIGVFFTSCSQAPGTTGVGETLLPLNYGYQRIFNMNEEQATWLAVPATYATGFGFMFIYGRQMCSMARSGLFPALFKERTSFSQSPYVALIIGSSVAAVGVVAIYYSDLTLLENIFNICVLSSYTIYIFVFLSYFIFKTRYSGVSRKFTNPLNIAASVFGICVFGTGLVSVIGFQGKSQASLIVFLVYLVFLVVYYYFYGFKTQKLSEEEHKVLFRAYVINGKAVLSIGFLVVVS